MIPRIALLLLALGVSPAFAGPESLEAYAWLIGVWTAHGSSPEAGEYTAEYAYEWTQNRKFMRTTYVQRAGDKVLWTDVGMVAIDPANGTLFGFNFGMDGSIGWGRSIEDPSPKGFLMEGNVVGPHLTPVFRFRLTRVGEDAIDLTLEEKEGDHWVSQPPETYRRKEKPEIAPVPEPEAATPPDALAPLAPFVGAWRGSRTSEDGRASAIEVSFEWRMSRNFLRRVQVVTDAGGAARETVEWIGWDPEKKTIAVSTFDADGKTARAAAKSSEGRLVVESSDGGPSRTSYRLDGEGHLSMSVGDAPFATLNASPARK